MVLRAALARERQFRGEASKVMRTWMRNLPVEEMLAEGGAEPAVLSLITNINV
jgi:hypothetical protein